MAYEPENTIKVVPLSRALAADQEKQQQQQEFQQQQNFNSSGSYYFVKIGLCGVNYCDQNGLRCFRNLGIKCY